MSSQPTFSWQAQLTISSLGMLDRLAEKLALVLGPGDVITLDGPLGAGKTTFSQKLAKALGVTEAVTSPTFVLMHDYESGPFPVTHVDLYRLGPEKADSMADELFAVAESARGLLLVEWACYGNFLGALQTVSIQMDYAPENEARQVDIKSVRPLLSHEELRELDA